MDVSKMDVSKMDVSKFICYILLCISVIYFIMLISEYNQLIVYPKPIIDTFLNSNFPIDAIITFRGEMFDLNDKREGYNYEIKYCLRSITKNMPWIRKIHIIQGSDALVPSFFSDNYMQNKVYLYNQNQIIPEKYSSTTNSNSIETFLTFLPDLSEHFIYFNDDWFVMTPIKSDYFFTNDGIPKRIKFNRQYIESDIIKAPPSPGENNWYPHIPIPFTKTEINEYLNNYPEFIEKVRSIKSRNDLEKDKISCHELNLTFPCMQLHTSIDYLGYKKIDNGETEYEASDYLEFPRDINKIKYTTKKFICLNDQFEGSITDRSRYRNELKNIMDFVFPEKSRAELE